MSGGYRCVNYYELCRLCTASQGKKLHIFSEEGKQKGLKEKIHKGLLINVSFKLEDFITYVSLFVTTIFFYRSMKMTSYQKLSALPALVKWRRFLIIKRVVRRHNLYWKVV